MGWGITGQSASSSSSSTTLGEGAIQAGANSANNTQNDALGEGAIATLGGNVTFNSTDGGILDTAGQITGQSLALLGHVFETAFGGLGQVVETGFGAANRATESVANAGRDAAASIAAAKGLDTVSQWRRYVPYLIGAAVAVAALVAWVRSRKGKS